MQRDTCVLLPASTDWPHAIAFIPMHVGAFQDGGKLVSQETMLEFNIDEDSRRKHKNGA